ncbi:MAG: hypothetical protein J6B37_07760 [Clostridia bacterium]|nr:hypothetical protein [Clostridia bacterium]
MKKNFIKLIALALVLTMMAVSFVGCSTSEVQRPVAVQSKTDLKDVAFKFTYGELKNVLPGDKLATLFENFNKKTDDRTVELSYYELVSKYGSEEYFDDILALISDEEWALFTGNQQEILDYFNKSINDIKTTGSARVSYNENFWINHGDQVIFKDANGKELPNQKEFRAAFRLYADTALKDIGSFLMNLSQEDATEFKADLTNVIYPLGEKTASTLTLTDLYTDKETKTYPIYTSIVPNFVYDLDDKGENAVDEEGEYIFVPTELTRVIQIAVKPEEVSVKKAFTVREKDGIMEQFKVAESYLKLNSFEIGFAPCKIMASINAVTDEMTYVTYEKNMVITANITFTGALAQYGTMIVEFPCTSSLTYNFGWPTAE